MTRLRKFWNGILWLYMILVVGGSLLHWGIGDQLWWLALFNIVAPYLFIPLVVLWPVDWLCQRRWRWWPLLLPALAFLGLYGLLFVPAWSIPTEPAEPTFSVMTFNIWGGSYQQRSTQVFARNNLPDIVAIQELRPFMMSQLLSVLAPHYPYHLLDGRGSGMGIFSRYPLTPLPVNFKLQPKWQLQVARVQMRQRSLILYNYHPRSTNIFLFLQSPQAGVAEVESSFQQRRQFMENLLADIASRTEPILLLGDFNSPPRSDVHKQLLTRFADAHLQAGWGFGHTFPAHGGRSHGIPIIPWVTRLDMILYSSELTALHSQVGIPSGESDHLPVVATLAWRARGEVAVQ